MKKITTLLIVLAFFASTTAAMAEDTMQRTLRDSLYGGLIGALLGTAVLLLTDNPDDHLSYIPTGAAVGVLVGAAYGVGRSAVRSASAAEIDEDGITFSIPTITAEKIYDEKLDEVEKIEKIDLVRLRF